MQEYDQLFKTLHIVEPLLQEEIKKVSEIVTIPPNNYIVEQEKYIKWLALVIKGRVRVWQENEERQILLYYVRPIETCVLSLTATFRDCKSTVYAKTETETTIVKIPVRYVAQWSFVYKSWNTFTTQSFMSSYDDLLESFKKLAFHKIDKRLYSYLEEQVMQNQTQIIALSHSQLAKELGTTREVISKILKQFELDGKVKLHFKKVELLKK